MKQIKGLCIGGLLAALSLSPVAAEDLDRVRTNSITAYTGFYIYVADKMGFSKSTASTPTRAGSRAARRSCRRPPAASGT